MLEISSSVIASFDEPYISAYCEDLRHYLMSEGIAPLVLLDIPASLAILNDFIRRFLGNFGGFDREELSRLTLRATRFSSYWDSKSGASTRDWLLEANSLANFELRLDHLTEEQGL